MPDLCANCGRSLRTATEIGTSGLYFPGGFAIDLCIDCYFAEESLIDDGTNDHPLRLAHYLEMLNCHDEAKRMLEAARQEGRLPHNDARS